MKQKNFLGESSGLIKPYFAIMSEYNKAITADKF